MKKSIAVLLALLAVCLLTGCGCEHEFGDWTVKQAATCTAEGTEIQTCTKCEETQERPLAMLSHSYGDWTVTQPATCTAEGTQQHTCTACGAAEEKSLEMLPHSYGAWEVVKQPGCLTEGQKQQLCTVCKAAATEPVAALGHSWKDATCLVPKTCTVCAATEGTVAAHTWADATCLDPKTCTVCKTTEGSALGHTWTDATCTDAKTCTVCKATEGKAKGHSWKDATCDDPKTCTVCGATEGSSNGHTYGKSLLCDNCGIKITGEFYKYLAGSDYRSIKRSYSQAEPHFAYVTLFVNKDGHICVLTDVWYKIISNYNQVTLHNLTTGKTIKDPADYYKNQANRAYGANKIKYMNMQGEILQILIKEKDNGTYVDADYLGIGT